MRRIVYYYTHLQQPFGEVVRLLSGDPGVWLPGPGLQVPAGWLVDLHADGALPSPLACHHALLEVGPAAATELMLLRAITWRSTRAERFMPVLEGDLELARLDGHGCQLSLRGSYTPPLSVFGSAGDRLLGHRVAEACARRFVLDAADRVAEAVVPA